MFGDFILSFFNYNLIPVYLKCKFTTDMVHGTYFCTFPLLWLCTLLSIIDHLDYDAPLLNTVMV